MVNIEDEDDNNNDNNHSNNNNNAITTIPTIVSKLPLTVSTCIQIIQEIYITIIIHSGIQLVPKDRTMFSRIKTTSDPFVRIILLNQLYGTTSIQYKTINPQWGTTSTTKTTTTTTTTDSNSTESNTTTNTNTNTTNGEQFIIHITNNKLIPQILRSSLLLTIWDYDRITKHDKMGIVTIPISDIVMNLHSTTTVPLPSTSTSTTSSSNTSTKNKIRSSTSKKIQYQHAQRTTRTQNSQNSQDIFHRQLYNVETGKGTKYYCHNATGQLDVSIASTIVTIDPTVTSSSSTVPNRFPIKSSTDNDSDSNSSSSSDDEYSNIKGSNDVVLPAALTEHTYPNGQQGQNQHQYPIFIPIGSTTDDDMDGRGSYCLSKIIRFVVSIDFDDTTCTSSSTCKINRQLVYTKYLDFVCVGLHRSTGEIILNEIVSNRTNTFNSNHSIYILTQDDTDDNDNEIVDANLIISCSLQQIPDDVYVLYFMLFVRCNNDNTSTTTTSDKDNTTNKQQSIHTFQQLFETYNISRINIRAEQCMASSSTSATTATSSFFTNDNNNECNNDNDSCTSNSCSNYNNNNTTNSSSTANDDDTVIYNELYVQSIQREDYPTSSTRKLSKLESIRRSILLVSSGLTSNCSTYYIGRLYRIDDTLTTTIAVKKQSTATATTTTTTTTTDSTTTKTTTAISIENSSNDNNNTNTTGTSTTKTSKTASTIAAIYNPLANRTMSMMKKLNIHSTSTGKKQQQQQHHHHQQQLSAAAAASSSSTSSSLSHNKDNDDNSTSTTSNNNIDSSKHTTVSSSSSRKCMLRSATIGKKNTQQQQQVQVQYDWALDQMDCIHMTGTNYGTILQDIKSYTKDIIPHTNSIPTSTNKNFAVLQTMDCIRLYDYYYYNSFTSNTSTISQPSIIVNTISFAFQWKSIPYSSAIIQQSSPPIIVPLRNDLLEKSNNNNSTIGSSSTNSNTSSTIPSRFPIVCISFDSTFQIIDTIYYKRHQSNDKSIRYSVEEVQRKNDNIYFNSNNNNPILYSSKEVFDINISHTTHHNNNDNTAATTLTTNAAISSSTSTSASSRTGATTSSTTVAEKFVPVVVPSANKKGLSKTVQYVCFIMMNNNSTTTTADETLTTPAASSNISQIHHHHHPTITNTYTDTISNISCTVYDETTLQTIATYTHNTQPQRIFGNSVSIINCNKNSNKTTTKNPSALVLGCFFLKQNLGTGPNSVSNATNSTSATTGTNENDAADTIDVEASININDNSNNTADWYFVALADECFQNFNANIITEDNVIEIQNILSKRNVT